MTPAEVLELAKEAMRRGRFEIRFHTEQERGPERHAHYHDIKRAVLSANEARLQNGTWQLRGGRDLDGDELIVAVAIDGQCIRIVTVF